MSYCRAVSPWDEERLQHALAQLVEAELLYQRGVPPHVTYVFKHALIQEAAYQSLLKSKRQQYHQQTVHILEQHFPEIADDPTRVARPSLYRGRPASAGAALLAAGWPACCRALGQCRGDQSLHERAGAAQEPAGNA